MANKPSAANRRQIVVLFVDICDSYGLYRELGDAAASALVNEFLAHLELPVRGHGGKVVDHIGDELMCSFTERAAAIRAAVEMQLEARSFTYPRPENFEISIRIGLDSGVGLEQDGKPAGDPVYVAKRLTDQAKSGQILLSEPSIVNLDMEVEFRFLEKLRLKGLTAPTSIYEVVWDGTDATDFLTANELQSSTVATGLELRLFDQTTATLFVGQSMTVGRIAPANLVMDDNAVSRLHARIEGRRGRFVLTDMSTNGTYVQTSADHEPRYLRRDEIGLSGTGVIGFGGPPVAGAAHTLEFRCTSD